MSHQFDGIDESWIREDLIGNNVQPTLEQIIDDLNSKIYAGEPHMLQMARLRISEGFSRGEVSQHIVNLLNAHVFSQNPITIEEELSNKDQDLRDSL